MIQLDQNLREEYNRLFNTCVLRKEYNEFFKSTTSTITKNITRYQDVVTNVNSTMPWYFIATIHSMESSLNFNCHLHNGDPLTQRTIHVPKGRPVDRLPPFSWEESAIDALKYKRLDQWKDWTIAGMLFKLEEYNGWGYRKYHKDVPTPYLWSFSNHYITGKYISDGRFSYSAKSKQLGGALIIKFFEGVCQDDKTMEGY